MTRFLLVAACVCLAGCAARGTVRPLAAPDGAPAAAIATSDWTRAATLATASGPLEARLVAWLHALGTGASARDIQSVLAASPEFPDQGILQGRYAAALDADRDDAERRALCAATRPHAARGLAACAQAEAAGGDTARAVSDARAAWRLGVDADPAGDAEAAFLAAWGGKLTRDDQWARFEALDTGSGSTRDAALREAGRLDPDRRALAETRVALGAGGAADPQALFSAVPVSLQTDPVLVLRTARDLRKLGANDAAVAFWRDHAASVERSGGAGFWTERDLLARALLQAGDAARAFTIADDPDATPDAARGDSLFLAGWIALRKLDRPDLAAQRFTRLDALSPSLITRARAAYWLARTEAARGDTQAALRNAARAAAFPTTFYGQRALGLLPPGPGLGARLAAIPTPGWSEAQALAFADEEMPRAAILLVSWGEANRARGFLALANQRATDPVDQALAARLALTLGLPDQAVGAARRAGRAGRAMPRLGWPRPVVPPPDLPAPLLLGLMRQESSFDAEAISPSGALGLMQLLPGTAAEMARAEGVHVTPARLTADPSLNMRLGAAYLASLMARFGNVEPAAVAAYNAGPHRVAGWAPAPGTGLDDPAMIDWIESIPVSETRNYVERVMENEAVYGAMGSNGAEASLGLEARG